MKVSKAQKEFCKGVVKKWRSRLFLGEWFIDLEYAPADEEVERGGRPAAQCWADPTYKIATITIFPCFWNQDKGRQTHCIVHELAHCQTQEVWNTMHSMMNGDMTTPQAVRIQVEKLTQRIANMVYQQEWK